MQQRKASVEGRVGTAAGMVIAVAMLAGLGACGLKGPLKAASPAASTAAASAVYR